MFGCSTEHGVISEVVEEVVEVAPGQLEEVRRIIVELDPGEAVAGAGVVRVACPDAQLRCTNGSVAGREDLVPGTRVEIRWSGRHVAESYPPGIGADTIIVNCK